jgi:hypothetical protein
MPRRLLAIFAATFASLFAALALFMGTPVSPVGAYVCGPTGSAPETNSKLQIFVSGDRVDETQWAFTVTPNPFTLGGSLRVVDNQSIDLTRSLNDILLEVFFSTVSGEIYTVTLDVTPPPPCPLVSNSLTRSAPQPTATLSDPQTAAFYFVAKCVVVVPTPTPTSTPPPSPTATPTPPPATPTPTVATVDLAVSPALIPCRGAALVLVTLRGELDADVTLTTTSGVITPSFGRATNGMLVARLDMAAGNGPQANGLYSNLIMARTARASGAASFNVLACPDIATPIPPLWQPPYYPPNNGPAPNGPVVVNNNNNNNNQQQQQQQQAGGGGFATGGQYGSQDPGGQGQGLGQGQRQGQSQSLARIAPPNTGEVDWSAVSPLDRPQAVTTLKPRSASAFLLLRLRPARYPVSSSIATW